MIGEYSTSPTFGPYAYDYDVLRKAKHAWYSGMAHEQDKAIERHQHRPEYENAMGQPPDAQYIHDSGIRYHELGQVNIFDAGAIVIIAGLAWFMWNWG